MVLSSWWVTYYPAKLLGCISVLHKSFQNRFSSGQHVASRVKSSTTSTHFEWIEHVFIAHATRRFVFEKNNNNTRRARWCWNEHKSWPCDYIPKGMNVDVWQNNVIFSGFKGPFYFRSLRFSSHPFKLRLKIWITISNGKFFQLLFGIGNFSFRLFSIEITIEDSFLYLTFQTNHIHSGDRFSKGLPILFTFSSISNELSFFFFVVCSLPERFIIREPSNYSNNKWTYLNQVFK